MLLWSFLQKDFLLVKLKYLEFFFNYIIYIYFSFFATLFILKRGGGGASYIYLDLYCGEGIIKKKKQFSTRNILLSFTYYHLFKYSYLLISLWKEINLISVGKSFFEQLVEVLNYK